LMRISKEVVAKARAVAEKTAQINDQDPITMALLQGLGEQIRVYASRADRVIDQTRRRVVFGEKVPAQEKIYSIFEPHTDLIKRGKVRKPLEFGHKVFFAETHRGLITDYEVLKGNPSDTELVAGSLERHRELFGKVPELYAADRGFHSAETVEAIRKAGVKQECMPQRGGHRTAEREAHEKSREFRKGQRFRAGIEGRISVLHRGRGTKRCPWSGRDGFEAYVGAAVLANNLLAIARLLRKRGAPQLRAA
jgi:IS5 family transposase